MIITCRFIAVVLIAFCVAVAGVAGCTSSKTIRSNVDSKKYQIVSDVYIYGARRGKAKPWFITSPGAFVDSKTQEDEYEKGYSRGADLSSWKIYSKLIPGDVIEIERSSWINSNSYSGYEIRARILSGNYEGNVLKILNLVISSETNAPAERWNIYEQNHPSPDTWGLDPRYFIEVK